MQSERRKYLRVLFEENIEVHTASWKDFRASSLDVSLSGVRFHCESSLSEMEELTVVFQPDLKLKGRVSWCWPVEWYYQSAIEFIEMNPIERQLFRKYISEVTGEIYPDYPDGEESPKVDEGLEVFEEPFHQSLVELTPLSFAGKKILLFGSHDDYSVVVGKYLSQRNQFVVVTVNDSSSLWESLQDTSVDLIMLLWDSETVWNDNLIFLKTLTSQFPLIPLVVLSGVARLEDRLSVINLGVADLISYPTHVTTISQSLLRIFLNIQSHEANISMTDLITEDFE